MATQGKATTTVSTKGQVILPKAIRDQRHWDAGTRLVVENTEAGVLLTQAPLFPKTTHEQAFGMLAYNGPAKSLEDMEIAGLPNLSVENPPLLAEALNRTEAGMDFADALHLGAAARCESLATFDRKFVKAASGLSPEVTEL